MAVVMRCKLCGGELTLTEGSPVAVCEYCGARQTVPTADSEKKLTLFARAGRLLRGCEFDKAAGIYESIAAEFPEEAEAYWCLVLCKYGIEYVDDPGTGKKVPTCHRSSFESVLEDENYDLALEYADIEASRLYRQEAKQIEELRRNIIEVSGKEEPYDIFICYKETAANGDRTLDSVLAQDIYDALTEKGYRVFFSRVTLEDKLGQEYEPYIFAALNSAAVMLAVGTDYEYYNAVWVKNEWSRFLQLMASGKKKYLIPCFKGMDPYDMPKEFARLQSQDMGKVGAMQDLLRGVEKLMGGSTAAAADDSLTRTMQAAEEVKAAAQEIRQAQEARAAEEARKAEEAEKAAAAAREAREKQQELQQQWDDAWMGVQKKYAALAMVLEAAGGRYIAAKPEGEDISFVPIGPEGKLFPYGFANKSWNLCLKEDGSLRPGTAQDKARGAETYVQYWRVKDWKVTDVTLVEQPEGVLCVGINKTGGVMATMLSRYEYYGAKSASVYARKDVINRLLWNNIVTVVSVGGNVFPFLLDADGRWFWGNSNTKVLNATAEDGRKTWEILEKCYQSALYKFAAPQGDGEAVIALHKFIKGLSVGERSLRGALERDRAALKQELANLKGLFSANRRKEIEGQLAKIDRMMR